MSTNLQRPSMRRGADRLRRGGLWLVFGTILMIPKVNRLRRRKGVWNLARTVACIAGAGMAALSIKTAADHHFAVIDFAVMAGGIFLLLMGLLVRPEGHQMSVDARARELGALIAVDGGCYEDAKCVRRRVKLFVGLDRVWVLDAKLCVLTEIPLQQVRALSLESAEAGWKLRLDSGKTRTEFWYGGTFAEHFARVAEATVRSRLYRELPVVH